MSASEARSRVTAVLGPTNTGKTYLAIERMTGHASGMIGFPLRLLARENYDRVVGLKGRNQVALVTGEEKIIPPNARYFCCTVESMPLDRPVDFLAVDEIQMAADPERGHVFTDRLLRARGQLETMFLGSSTIQPVLRRLVPEAEFISRPRLSNLSYVGPRKITRLKPRSAVVAFSVADVYQIAELLRRQRGGTAVVLGALSPRTRNAQVDMYQAGEVDYLVATDAIGMGLNMNVDHVAFWRLGKFDGRKPRRLTASEVAQIAGRAGRHTSDGTFGTVAELGPMDADMVAAIENHEFDSLSAIQWRNTDLEFRTARALRNSLEARPPDPALVRARQADDHVALSMLMRDADVAALAVNPDAVRRLWDVCQIPDFRKTMADIHARLLTRIYKHLMGEHERLPVDWVADQIARLDRTDGDIDTLMARIAHVRTWTYISYRGDWLDDAAHWQQRARALEDKLSDALHERLLQRFVDRRAAVLTRLKDKPHLDAAVMPDGDIVVEDHFVGRLDGFRFVPDSSDTVEGRRALIGAANRILRGEIAARANRLAADPDDQFEIRDNGAIAWRGAEVARLKPGDFVLAPGIDVIAGDLTAEKRERVRARLARLVESALQASLGPLLAVWRGDLSGPARGIAFRLAENLGSLPRLTAAEQAAALDPDAKRALREFGVRLGHESIFIPTLVRPKAARLRAILWSVHNNAAFRPPPPPGLVTVAVDPDDRHGAGAAFLEACGYRVVGDRAIRIDILDRVAINLRRLSKAGPFALPVDILNLLGLTADQAVPVLAALNYRPARAKPAKAAGKADDGAKPAESEGKADEAVGETGEAEKPDESAAAPLFEFVHPRKGRKNRKDRKAPPRKPGKRPSGKPRSPRVDPDSPFAKLRELRTS